MKNTVHITLHSKGGIGKSFVATLLAQHFQRHENIEFAGYNIDPEGTMFARYRALSVEHIPVLGPSRQVDAGKFDILIEKLLRSDAVAVIDTGTSTFAPLLAYLMEGNVIKLLQDNGKKVYIHTVIAGGAMMSQTANGFDYIASAMNVPLILWMNEFFGEMTTTEGKPFTETKVYSMHQAKLAGVITLPKPNRMTLGDDIERMTTRQLTISEVMQSADFGVMEKKRIGAFARDVFMQLEQIAW